jgi:transcriptional regulator with GAF, ATPase, and Fis domain
VAAPAAAPTAASTAATTGAEDAPALADRLLAALPSLDEIEALLLSRALAQAGGNVSAAARRLRVGRGQMDYRLKRRGR